MIEMIFDIIWGYKYSWLQPTLLPRKRYTCSEVTPAAWLVREGRGEKTLAPAHPHPTPKPPKEKENASTIRSVTTIKSS